MSKVYGDAHLKKVLLEIEPAVRSEVLDAIETTGRELLEDMQANCPISEFKGPHLRDALDMRTSRNELSVRVGLLYRRTQRLFFYWRFLEFGTVRAAARPFVMPALTREDVRYGPRVRAAVDAALRRAAGF